MSVCVFFLFKFCLVSVWYIFLVKVSLGSFKFICFVFEIVIFIFFIKCLIKKFGEKLFLSICGIKFVSD